MLIRHESFVSVETWNEILGQIWAMLIPAEALIYYYLLMPVSVPVRNYYKPWLCLWMEARLEISSRQQKSPNYSLLVRWSVPHLAPCICVLLYVFGHLATP